MPLSDAALSLLRRRASGEDVPVTDESRPAYRELAQAGVMVVGHSFSKGREAFYTFSGWGWKLAGMMDRLTAPSPSESAAPRP